MKRTALTVFPILTILLSLLQAQPDTLWTRTYGGASTEMAVSLASTGDGGYIIAAETQSFGEPNGDLWLVRVNADGDTQWTKVYGGDGRDSGGPLEPTIDGGWILATTSESSWGHGSSDAWLVKIAANGDTTWTRTFGDDNGQSANMAIQTSDGGYVVVGRDFTPGQNETNDVWLIKTDSNGEEVWSKHYGGSGEEYGLCVRETSEDSLIIAGYTESFGSGLRDLWLLKTNANGDSLWSAAYGGTGNDADQNYCDLIITADGGFLVTVVTESFGAGEGTGDIWLLKTDASGDSLWSKTFGGDGAETPMRLKPTADGGYLISGFTDSFGAGSIDGYLIKTDANGDSTWTMTAGGSGMEAFFDVEVISADNYIATGVTSTWGAGDMDGWLVRLGTAAGGETVTWDGEGGDNYWTTAANWSGDAVPGSADDVVIALDGATVSIPYGPLTIASLILGGGDGEATETLNTMYEYNQGGMRLTVTGSVTIDTDGYLNMDGWAQGDRTRGDSLIANGGLANYGSLSLNRGSSIKGNVTNSAVLESDGNGDFGWTNTIDGTLTNNVTGSITITGGENSSAGYLEVKDDLSNAGWIKLYTQQYAPYPTWFTKAHLVVSAGTFTNIGTIVDTSTTHYYTERTITASNIDNQGIIAAKAPHSIYSLGITTASAAGTIANSGLIHVEGGVSFNNVSDFTNTGTIIIDTSRTLALSGFEGSGTYTGSGEQFRGNGTLSVDDIALNVSTFPALDSLNLILSGSSSLTLADSLIIHRSISVTGSNITAAGVRNQGSLSLTGGAVLTSDVTNNATLVLNGGVVTGAVSNSDSMNVGSNAAVTGAVTNGASAKIIVTNAGSTAGLTVDGGLTNHGYLELNPTASGGYTLLSVTNGSLTNAASGTIQGTTGYTGTSSFAIQADLVNEGIFDSNFKIYFNGGSHSNGGTLRINQAAAGTYQIMHSQIAFQNSATFTNTGTVFMDTTASLSIVGATYQGAAGALDGTGRLTLSRTGTGIRSTGYLGQKFVVKDYGVKLSCSNSTIHVDSLINQTTWTAIGDTVYADSVIINQGKLTLEPYASSPYTANAWYGPFINQDTLIVIKSNNYLDGPVVNEADAAMFVHSAAGYSTTLTVDSSLTNSGTLELLNADGGTPSANLTVSKGWLTNTATGVINNLIYSQWQADLNNQGTFNINPTTTLTLNKTPEYILNSGTIHVQGGDYFQVSNLDSLVVSETGLLQIDAGCTAKFNGASVSGTFPSPESQFVMTEGAEINLLGNIEGTYLSLYPGPMLYIEEGQKVTFTSSRVFVDSLINEGYLTMKNTTINGEVVNRDTLVAQSYGAAFDSTLVNDSGGVIRGEGNYSNGWTYLNVNNSFTNHGELELTTISTTSKGIQVHVEAGSLVNASTGSIDALVGTSTNTALEHKFYTDLVNQGSLTLDSAAVVTVVGTSFDNEPGGVVQGEGTLDVSSVVFTSAGAVNPGGSPGILTIEGDMALETTNVINLELEGDEPGTGYDQLNVTGNAALAGSLHVSIIDPYSPDEGKTFLPLTYGSSSGVFESLATEGGGKFLSAHITETGVYLTASISGGNSWPFIGGITDITAPEDTTLAIVLKVFDPDEADVLTFSASSDTPAVQLTLDEDTLLITPELNWNGVANIEVIVSDLAGLRDTTDFTLTLSPVQDAPLAFDLIAPVTDSTITITADNQYSQSLVCSWDASVDPDGETVNYDLVLTGDLTQLPTRTIYSSNTSVSWSYAEIVTAMSGAGMQTFSGTWTIAASDPLDSTTTAANGPFNLTIDASTILGVDGRELIPEVFALHANYPNPFNPSTTIRYDLPKATEVILTVYDLMGREVVRLVRGRMEAGYQQVIWDGRTAGGREVPSGIYITRMVTPEYSKSMKMVLLK